MFDEHDQIAESCAYMNQFGVMDYIQFIGRQDDLSQRLFEMCEELYDTLESINQTINDEAELEIVENDTQ